jgi:hypothetical protein
VFPKLATLPSNHSPDWAMRPNSALVYDVCAAALRAFFNASQRGR